MEIPSERNDIEYPQGAAAIEATASEILEVERRRLAVQKLDALAELLLFIPSQGLRQKRSEVVSARSFEERKALFDQWDAMARQQVELHPADAGIAIGLEIAGASILFELGDGARANDWLGLAMDYADNMDLAFISQHIGRIISQYYKTPTAQD